jgi:hypothetical protein
MPGIKFKNRVIPLKLAGTRRLQIPTGGAESRNPAELLFS